MGSRKKKEKIVTSIMILQGGRGVFPESLVLVTHNRGGGYVMGAEGEEG